MPRSSQCVCCVIVKIVPMMYVHKVTTSLSSVVLCAGHVGVDHACCVCVCVTDACHTLTCALMLLNNDLHGQVSALKCKLIQHLFQNIVTITVGVACAFKK